MSGALLTLFYDTDTFDDALRPLALFPKEAKKALHRALRKTIQGCRTDTVRIIREQAFIKAAEVRKHLGIIDARWVGDEVTAELIPQSKRFPLRNYRISPKKMASRPSDRPARGISAQILRGKGMKVIPGTFIPRLRSGHLGVFRRTPDARWIPEKRSTLAIKEMTGPSVQFFFRREAVIDQLEEAAQERIETNVRREVDWILRSGR